MVRGVPVTSRHLGRHLALFSEVLEAELPDSLLVVLEQSLVLP